MQQTDVSLRLSHLLEAPQARSALNADRSPGRDDLMKCSHSEEKPRKVSLCQPREELSESTKDRGIQINDAPCDDWANTATSFFRIWNMDYSKEITLFWLFSLTFFYSLTNFLLISRLPSNLLLGNFYSWESRLVTQNHWATKEPSITKKNVFSLISHRCFFPGGSKPKRAWTRAR